MAAATQTEAAITQTEGARSVATAGRPFWPRRNWWLALLAILLLAGALRYPGYAFSLPYLDQSDEIFFALPARMIIDFARPSPM